MKSKEKSHKSPPVDFRRRTQIFLWADAIAWMYWNSIWYLNEDKIVQRKILQTFEIFQFRRGKHLNFRTVEGKINAGRSVWGKFIFLVWEDFYVYALNPTTCALRDQGDNYVQNRWKVAMRNHNEDKGVHVTVVITVPVTEGWIVRKRVANPILKKEVISSLLRSRIDPYCPLLFDYSDCVIASVWILLECFAFLFI